eukprot:466191_1
MQSNFPCLVYIFSTLLFVNSQQYSPNCSFTKIGNETKICVTNSHNQIWDGEYQFQSFNPYLTGSAYHHITENKYFSGFCTSDNQQYYIHSYESDNVTMAKCVISHSDDFISCMGKWTFYYNNSWHSDPNINAVPCQDRCVKNNSKSWINNGVFKWIAFNTTRLTNIYHCRECNTSTRVNGSYLYGWEYDSGNYEWQIGHDADSGARSAKCDVGSVNDLGSSYTFRFEDCDQWEVWNGSSWVQDRTTVDLCDVEEDIAHANIIRKQICIDGADNDVLNDEYWWLYDMNYTNASVYYNVNNEIFIYPFINDSGYYYWQIGINTDTGARCKLSNTAFNFNECANWEIYKNGEWINNPDIFITYTVCPADVFIDSLGFEWGLILFVIAVVVWICMYCYDKRKRKKERKESVTWDTLFDFNDIRSNFKSSQVLQIYLFEQDWSIEMVISNLFLMGGILVNTYTNSYTFVHYSNTDFDGSFQSLILGRGGAIYMSLLEFSLTYAMIALSMFMYIFKDYDKSIGILIGWVPNISALVYFRYLNTDFLKQMICNCWYSNRSYVIGWLPMLILMVMVGLWVFVTKVNQISYIYTKDIETLDWGDLFAVVGIARQFANLSSCGRVPYFGFAFSTIHPVKVKELKEDKKWMDDYDIDKIVCREMITKHGLWGYCWLCYTFKDESNVKKLYLQNDCLSNDNNGGGYRPPMQMEVTHGSTLVAETYDDL